MAEYLMDTNHLSPLVTLHHPLRHRFLKAQQLGHAFALTIPALTETLFGLSLTHRSRQNLAEWQRLMPGLTVYDLNRTDAEQAADLQLQLRRQGWQLGTVDALIAAVALRYNLTLLTTDKDFSAVPLLKQENWLRQLIRP
jgi:predicted nucleic acid-binding protein